VQVQPVEEHAPAGLTVIGLSGGSEPFEMMFAD
jgi:hypothetical protein